MPELLDLATRIVGWARDGEAVEVFVAHTRDTDVIAYDGDVESLSSAESSGVGIRVVAGGRQGFAYAGTFDDDVVRETLDEARDNAEFATPDEFVGLAEPDGVDPVQLDVWRDDLAGLPAARKVELALELERLVKAGDPRIRSLRSASWGDGALEAALASSTGIAVTWRRTGAHLSAQAVAGEGDETQTGYGYSVGRGPAEVDVEEAAADTVARTVRLLGARKPPSAHLPVVLDRRVTTSFLSVLAATLSGEAVLKGRSFFADRLGETVAAAAVTLVDDPTVPDAYSASPFDAEGLASRRNVLIEGGVLRGFVYNTYAGRRAGVPSTASAVRAGFKSTPGVGCRALSLAPGTRSPEAIYAEVGDGLLVTGVSGLHSGVNPVSGDFSVGAEGLLIRDGRPVEPVREITIASTLQRMLQEIVAVGDDLEWLPSMAAGTTLAIGGMSMSGA